METKLWNRDPINGFTSEFSLGGLPIFTEDLQASQDVSTELYGLLGLLKGWSCILRGCYIDDLDITNKRCSITEGIILLNDTVYYVPAQTNLLYPFALIKGTQTIDSRVFKDGVTKDVAIGYNYGMRTSFTYPSGTNLNSTIPSDLGNEAIYFDPFTAQRAEYILNGRSKSFKEIISVNNNLNAINKTETGKSIIGGTLGAIVNGSGRWKYLGFTNFTTGEFVLRNATATGIGTLTGVNDITLTKGNIPAHVHGTGTLSMQTAGEHSHTLHFSKVNLSGDFGSFRNGGADYIPPPENVNASMDLAGGHTHQLQGSTSDGTADSLKVSPNSFSVRSNSLYVNMLQWNGYQSVQSFYKFYKNVLPFSNM